MPGAWPAGLRRAGRRPVERVRDRASEKNSATTGYCGALLEVKLGTICLSVGTNASANSVVRLGAGTNTSALDLQALIKLSRLPCRLGLDFLVSALHYVYRRLRRKLDPGARFSPLMRGPYPPAIEPKRIVSRKSSGRGQEFGPEGFWESSRVKPFGWNRGQKGSEPKALIEVPVGRARESEARIVGGVQGAGCAEIL